VSLLDSHTGKEIRSMVHTRHGGVNDIALAPDGKRIAVASWDRDTRPKGGERGTISLWDLGTGRLLASFRRQPDFAMAVTFSGDGRTLAVGVRDGSLKLWDLDGSQVR